MVLAALFSEDSGTVVFCLWYPADFEVSLTSDISASTYRTEKLQYFLESSWPSLQCLFLAQSSQMAVNGPSGAFFKRRWNSYFVFVLVYFISLTQYFKPLNLWIEKIHILHRKINQYLCKLPTNKTYQFSVCSLARVR